MILGNLQGLALSLSEYELFDAKRDWRGKKMKNEILALAYDKINPDKALRLRDCSSVILYKRYSDGTMKLDGVKSCRVRLCPICSWRRSLKVYSQTRQIIDYLNKIGKYRYIMLTLTIKNCDSSQLSSTLDTLTKGWDRFAKLTFFKSAVCGWYRSLEVTHDVNPFITREMYYGNKSMHIYSRASYYRSLGLHVGDANPNYDTYHPHFHVLLAVKPSYYTGRAYIKQSVFSEWWKNSLRADYLPVCDVRTVKGHTSLDIDKAVSEVAKYSAKDADYLVSDDWDLTINTVETLDFALSHRRLIAYGGCMAQARKILKQDDAETGDLVHVGEDSVAPDIDYSIISYFWYSGYRQYYCL